MRRSSLTHRLSATTALIASLSFALPVPVVAQESLPNCADGSAAPCLPGQEPLGADGLPVPGTTMTEDEIAARKAAEEAAQPAEAQPAEAQPSQAQPTEAQPAEAQPAEAQPAEAQPAEAQPLDAQPLDAQPLDAQPAETQPLDQPTDQGEVTAPEATDQGVAADQSQGNTATPDEGSQKKGKKVGGKGKKKKADAAAETQTDQPQAGEATAPATDAGTAPATAEEAAPATGDSAATPPPETAPAATENTAAPADQGTAATPATEAPAAEAPATEAPATDAATTTEATPPPAATDAAAADGAATAEVPVLPVQPDAASGEAPVAAAAAAAPEDTAAAADAPPPAGATVVEETVTADSVRSSSEDFATTVNQTLTPEQKAAAAAATGPAAAQPAAKKKDKGLTDFEKALLIGVGAVAVGAILSNNRKVAANSGDRVVVEQQDGSLAVIKDDDTLLRQPGSTVRTERFADGSTRATVTRPDGSRIVTIRDAEYRVLRRVHIAPDGRQTLLIDDTTRYDPVVVSQLPKPRKPREVALDDETALRLALAGQARATGRAYSLAQIRDIDRVRELAPAIDLQAITFDTGSAAISPDQARSLSTLGQVIEDFIAENPREVFLVEGHTDAVGNAAYNLALSDRRAETVALALTEYFDIPPENLVVQGYGEEFLKVDTQAAERANRRATVRRITDLLRQAAN
jgi:outer membrane protein OmpA-like peptidoglycan-associated protein